MTSMNRDWGWWMRRALREAARGTGETGPNPLVGALVVRGEECVGSGYHRRVGGPHAEVFALEEAGERANGADIVVTLEPCSHHGRTGPCAQRIIDAGVRRVIVGTLDPNPRERGRGVAMLRQAGLDVLVGVEERRCRIINEPYFKFITTGLPFVTVKFGASIDGRIGVRDGRSQAVTGAEYRRFVHGLRRDSCAVMVGGRTAVLDNPQLTVRFARPATRPLRVVIVGSEAPPEGAHLFSDGDAARTIVYHGASVGRDEELARVRRRHQNVGGEWVEVAGDSSGHPLLLDIMQDMGRRGVSRLLVEGGGRLAGALLREGLVDRWVVGWAPKLLGASATPMVDLGPGESGAWQFRLESCKRMGEEVVGVYRLGHGYLDLIEFSALDGEEKGN